MFALIDCNNFYCSCERVFNPKWNHKPIVILSNNDGCIIARSNEAKALGIPMGAPYFKYKDFLNGHNVIVRSSNYTLYGDMSARVMKTLRTFSFDMQVYSIDEAFLKLTEPDPEKIAREIRKKVLQWTGIPVSIGIAPTKTLAKVASHCAKKNPAHKGVFTFKNSQETTTLLDTLPVTEIWGIGDCLGKRLNKLGIITAKDFRDADDGLIKKHLSILGLRTALELRGIPCFPLTETPPSKKSITCSRSFGRPIDNITELYEAIATYTARAAEKIREQDTLATVITVFIEKHPFTKCVGSSLCIRISPPEPTNYTPDLIHFAKIALKQLFQEGCQYRKVGVVFDDLIPVQNYQRDLFSLDLENSTRYEYNAKSTVEMNQNKNKNLNKREIKKVSKEKQDRLMKVMDSLNQRYGHPVIQTAAEGITKDWKMKQGLCSQRFTTNWDDILRIHV